jgi:DNA-binding NtrC family response regulator
MPTPRPPVFEPNPLWQRAREPIFWLDPALKLTWVNRAWEELTGYPAAAVVGLTCQAHAPTQPGDASDLAASFHPPPESLAGRPAGAPTLIYRADGERLWRRVEFWPFCDEQSGLIGLLGMVRADEAAPSVPDSRDGRLHAELLEIRRRLHQRHGLDALIGSGPAHRRLLEQVRLAAGSAVPVLIVGEPGTGKRHVARTIHQHGPNRHRPFLAFDCEALPAEILERELFGAAAPGASDGAGRRPRLSLGDGSTLLIDEVLSLPRDLQARLVEALDAHAPVRPIATTAREPEAAVDDERLRPDLYYALTALVVRLRPLRDRRDELPALAQHFLERINRHGVPQQLDEGDPIEGPDLFPRANRRGVAQRGGFTPEAVEVLTSYDWPGNLPELARVVEHAHGRADGHVIAPEDLPATIRGHLGGAYNPPAPPSPIKPLDELLTEVERRAIETALRQSRSNKSRAAEILGISRPRLYRRIKELNLPDEEEPAEDDGPPE